MSRPTTTPARALPRRPESATIDTMYSIVVAIHATEPSPVYLAEPVRSSTASAVLVESRAEALTFTHPEPARRQAIALRRTLSDEWTVTVEQS